MNEGGRKDDQDKLRYELIPPEALAGLADVYTRGAKKYASRNWEAGIAYGRIYGGLMRHLEAWRQGEDRDPENGQHHLDSVAWAAFALRTYEARGKGAQFDDLRQRNAPQIDAWAGSGRLVRMWKTEKPDQRVPLAFGYGSGA